MLQLLFLVIMAETTAIMLLLFKSPLRTVVLAGLDQMKRGRGPIVIKTICATIFVVLLSTLFSSVMIQRRGRSDDVADLSPTDQVLFSKNLLDSTLMGFILFLVLMIDRLHHYIRELTLRRKTMEFEASRSSNTTNFTSEEEVKAREQQVDTFKEMIRHLESELESKTQEANASEANIEALRKQSEGLLLEYDKLLGQNQELREQLKSMDLMYSHSPTKKDP